jgi:hypothetical protein
MSGRVTSRTRSAKRSRSWFTCSGVIPATITRRWPSRLRAATSCTAAGSWPRKRSIALPTQAGSVLIFTVAIASTSIGVPPWA